MPSRMAFYTGDQFPYWKGNLLIGALRDEMLVRLELKGENKSERCWSQFLFNNSTLNCPGLYGHLQAYCDST